MSLVWNFSFEADFCISKLFSAVAIIFFVSEIEGKKKSLKKVFLWKKERKKERNEGRKSGQMVCALMSC